MADLDKYWKWNQPVTWFAFFIPICLRQCDCSSAQSFQHERRIKVGRFQRLLFSVDKVLLFRIVLCTFKHKLFLPALHNLHENHYALNLSDL